MGLQDENRESFDDALAKANAAERNKAPPTHLADVIDLTDDDIRKLCRNELVIALKANSGKPVVSNIVNALLDRVDGKPAQSVQLDATVRKVTVNATISYIMPPKVEGLIIDHVDNVQVIDNE